MCTHGMGGGTQLSEDRDVRRTCTRSLVAHGATLALGHTNMGTPPRGFDVYGTPASSLTSSLYHDRRGTFSHSIKRLFTMGFQRESLPRDYQDFLSP